MSSSTINVVKYYFHKRHIPESEEYMRKLVALAYQTAREKKLYPRAVFIRYVTLIDRASSRPTISQSLGEGRVRREALSDCTK